jgi:hypothetical protein
VAESNVAALKRATLFRFHSPHETGEKGHVYSYFHFRVVVKINIVPLKRLLLQFSLSPIRL